MYVNIVVLVFLFGLCDSASEDTTDKLIKFRDDINQISIDLENFIYDIVQESLADENKLAYPNYEFNALTNALMKPPKPKIMNSLRKQTSNLKDNIKKYLSKGENEISTTTAPTNVLDNYFDNYVEKTSNFLTKNGLRRSRRDTNLPGIMEVRNTGSVDQKNDCARRTDDQCLERQHLEDLKDEVNKLRDLVVMLKDQQKIISVLDKDNTRDTTNKISSHDLVKILNNFKVDNKSKNIKSETIADKTEQSKVTYQELEKIKYDLSQTISNLNKTREMLLSERIHEITLENELNRQKNELNILKMMVEKLYNNSSHFLNNFLNATSETNDLVGASIYKFKDNKNTTRTAKRTDNQRRNDHPHLRANELSNLLEELDKKNREDDVKKLVSKLMEEKESKTINSISNSNDMVKNLQKVLQLLNKPQTKTDDETIEAELMKLNNAINSLKPSENFDQTGSSVDVEKLRELIDVLTLQNGRGLHNGGGGSPNRGLSPQEIINLRRRLEQVSGNGLDAHQNALGNFGMGPQSLDINKRGYVPYPYPAFPGPYGNYPPSSETYRPPFSNPYGQLNGYGFVPAQIPPDMYLNDNFGSFNPGHSYPSNYGTSADTLDYRGKHYGLNSFPTDYSKPSDGIPSYDLSKITNPFSAEYNKQYGLHFTPNAYGKSYMDAQKSPPYASDIPTSPDYSASSASDQFFPGSQSNAYEKPFQNSVYPTENVDGNHQSQSNAYLPKNLYNAEYSTKNIEELKTQVNSLQNVINSLNYSGYAKKPEDQQTITNLEQQINELKGIINTLNQDVPPNQATYSQNMPNYNQNPVSYDQQPPITQPNYPNSRRKRSVSQTDDNSQLFDQITSKFKEYLFSSDKEEKNPYQTVQARINDIQSELDQLNYFPQRNINYNRLQYQPNTFNKNARKTRTFDLVKEKKTDLLKALVAKIVDKIISVIPTIVEKIFGHGIHELVNFHDDDDDYYDGYGNKMGYNNNNQKPLTRLFKSFGVFGFGPLIFLKVVDGFTTFFNTLKKNNFLKNFLIPAAVVLIVAGATVFLIFWLQPKDNKQVAYQNPNYYNNYYPNYNSNPNTYRRNINHNKVNDNSPRKIFRSYFENQ